MKQQRLTFLHTNDSHSSFEQELRLGSLIRRRRAELRAEGVPVLLVDGGDHVDMSVLECMATDGQLNLDLHAALAYDAAGVGNNELMRFSLERVRELSLSSQVPWLLANLREQDGSLIGGMRESLLLDAGGVQVGFVGITDQVGTTYEEFVGLQNTDTVTTVREIATNLRAAGADLIVVLSHAGLNQDLALAPQWTGLVDVIVGAHTHDALHEPQLESGVWIVQAGAYARLLGELHLELDLDAPAGQKIVTATGQLLPVEADEAPDAELAAIYQLAVAHVEKKMSEVLTTLEAPLSHDRLIQELATTMREFYGVELGMMFGAVAVEGFPAGPVTVGDVLRNLQSLVNVSKIEFQGQQLLGLLYERNDPAYYARIKFGNGIRPKSGVPVGRIFFDGLTWDEQEGAITNVRVNGEPLEHDRWYTVGGGEHLAHVETLYYPSLAGAKLLHVDDYYYVKDAFVAYLRQSNVQTEQEVSS
ncbi:bifunctional metallophosphatase/5'-nucleotidase [Tumebacillus permanentifrigoris]|uniref:5'-nucleotidase n=1 Tax=Tumebacillus permanentifrigoris TaxID=378543 RepID=A0A316DFX2_9BACL|nr:5'-nucleotidase C-terminal domain-containing protein [Tumebacillus permanentifrigoris]PWK16442.1 5'-nucleotidase [Tumebacillus permanentifrigoris]